MITVGMDLEQFLEDPFGSGIQRVLQQLRCKRHTKQSITLRTWKSKFSAD